MPDVVSSIFGGSATNCTSFPVDTAMQHYSRLRKTDFASSEVEIREVRRWNTTPHVTSNITPHITPQQFQVLRIKIARLNMFKDRIYKANERYVFCSKIVTIQ